MKIQEIDTKTGNAILRDATPEEMAEFVEVNVDEVAVPPTVTSRQIRMQLAILGINLSDIDAMLDALPEPEKTFNNIQWKHSGIFERNNPILIQLAGQMGINEEQLDQLFINANSL